MILKLLLILSCLPWLIKIYLNGLKFIHIAQLEGYSGFRLAGWLKKAPASQKISKPDFFTGAGLLAVTAGGALFFPPSLYIFTAVIALWAAGPLYLIFTRPEILNKKPLVKTPRAVRLITAFEFLTLLETVLWMSWSFSFNAPASSLVPAFSGGMLFFWGGFWIIGLLAPVNVLLAAIFIQPLENQINAYYFRKSARKVRSMDRLKIIGITGSYGKTSTKYILHTILELAHTTLMTPESYNTPMGVSKVIQQELDRDYQCFIVEMGARQRHDIQELCRLTPPIIGILTTIGEQHLETFKSVENIVQTKGDLIRALPADGTAVLNFDNPSSLKIRDWKLDARIVGIAVENPEADLVASNIRCDREGLKFTVKDNRTGEEAEFVSQLLGRHNVYNFLSAAAAALDLGLELEYIAWRAADVRPVPHRLEMIVKVPGGVIIIDDAFNSNPAGAKTALEVLESFESGRKLLITPGFVELGEKEEQENFNFGELAARVCDYVLLVGGKQISALAGGMEKQGFHNFKVCADLNEAVALMQSWVKDGDVVLFENDLPDFIYDR